MRFKVGDFVVLRAEMEQRRLFTELRWKPPLLLQVLETLQQTCSAGVEQSHYKCRLYSDTGFTDVVAFNEIELEAAPTGPATDKQPE